VTKIDLVVLDMKMPGIGGLEVMRRIRREQPGIKFILMTGRGSLEEGEEGMQEGAFAYLLKPINIEDLVEKMMEAVRV
jgi:DNA-binding NtrC family response regulator